MESWRKIKKYEEKLERRCLMHITSLIENYKWDFNVRLDSNIVHPSHFINIY